MNRKNFSEFVTRFRDKVPERQFNMQYWVLPVGADPLKYHRTSRLAECFTVGCMAGWLCYLFDIDTDDPFEKAIEFLGCVDEEEYAMLEDLFYGDWACCLLEQVTKAQALAKLERMEAELERMEAELERMAELVRRDQ